MTKKKNQEEFQILDAREHCRARPGMYVGSTTVETYDQFLLGEWKPVTYVPAINKMISEVLDNSIDENIRTDGKYADKIDVSFDGDSVTVTDNGRGIPQEDVTTPEGNKIARPVAAWTRNNAGTSFGETRSTIGAHGLGAALVNYMSATFIGRTWQNDKLLEVACSDGCKNIDVKTKKKAGNGTQVTFTPDFKLFDVDTLQDLDTVALVEDRLMSLQLAFPNIRFSFNKKKLHITDMKKYASLFTPEDASVILDKNENLSFFFVASDDGFRSNSFINGVNTRQGGVYVDYVVNGVMDELATMIKRKHKIDVAKSTLKNGITFVLFARDFVNPKFDSQTKERLTNSLAEVRNHYAESGAKDFKFLAKKLFAADDIIEPIIAAQIAKKEQQERRAALQGQKKLKKIKVAKHVAASTTDAALSLCEGDCLSVDTLIETSEGSKTIKEIQPGDLVFTHKHRYKKVLSKAYALKEGVSINGVIMSKEHRMFVYDTLENEFDFLAAKNIDKHRHKLIRNRIVYHGIDRSMHLVERKIGNTLYLENGEYVFSDSHEIITMNGDLECIVKTVKDIDSGEIVFL